MVIIVGMTRFVVEEARDSTSLERTTPLGTIGFA